jgi:hypothetical protein
MAEDCQHPPVDVDRHHLVGAAEQLPGKVPGAGSQVHHQAR